MSFIHSTISASNRIPATADDLRKLDLYGDLIAMPKGTEAEQDQGLEIPLPSESTIGKQISKKELGRLRSKQAVLAKLQASVEGTTDMPGSEGDDTREPKTKKTKSDEDDSSEGVNVDVSMAGQ
jgi:tRNA (guanine-N(7)-)-methyltransferase subunit TRM82